MKLLITGVAGQVGIELCAFASKRGIDYQGYSSAELDITRENKVWRALRRAKPAVVINAAAYTAVDAAEDDLERCFAVNRDGVGNLAKACSRLAIPLIHISTDYVFDGAKAGAYIETDAVAPLNAYGESKLQGENLLRQTLEQHIILRISWVFSRWRTNFVKTMIRLSQEREELRIIQDQHGCPTPAIDAARVLIAIAEQLDCGASAWGTYHYCGREQTAWHGFAQEILDEVSKYRPLVTQKLIPIASAEYPVRARRPLNSVMNCKKILETFGIQQRSWKPEMADVVYRILRPEPSSQRPVE